MAVLVNALKGLAYAAITFLCVVVGITVLQVRAELKQLSNQANVALVDLHNKGSKDIDKLYEHAKLEQKNFDYLVLNLGTTAAVARRASMKELAVLDELNASIKQTVDNTNKTLLSTNTAVTQMSSDSSKLFATANQTVKDIQPTLAASTAALQSFNKVVSDPAIHATIANAADATSAITDTVKHTDAMVVDTADVWHKFLHPTWPHRVWSAITGQGMKLAPLVVK